MSALPLRLLTSHGDGNMLDKRLKDKILDKLKHIPSDSISEIEGFDGPPQAVKHLRAGYLCLVENDGLDPNYEQAVVHFKRAAAAGSAAGFYNLGLLTMLGRGLPHDQNVMAAYFLAGAKAGSIESAFSLGMCFALACGVPTNHHKAIVWLKRAANAGHVSSKVSLAVILSLNGQSEEAAFWFKEAAKDCHPKEKLGLGAVFLAGDMVPCQPTQGAKLILEAAEQGQVEAQTLAGLLFASGFGLPRDLDLAFYWLGKAQAANEPLAVAAMAIYLPLQKKLDLLKPVLTIN
ncbi:MAG: sel1 repeat family protein [Deltaproteobacteria bacterium]|jgi:TPR repeat protein|nr:sel1 repeat family protein [Deltaproteobacteria bacterium]